MLTTSVYKRLVLLSIDPLERDESRRRRYDDTFVISDSELKEPYD